MINKVKTNIWQLYFKKFGSCIYLLKIKKDLILIDTGSILTKFELKKDLKDLKIDPKKINKIILTHNHWDHTGGISLFKDAKVYGDKKDFKRKSIIEINKLPIKELKIIKTPGHTEGSFCILYKDILFSGDTLFNNGYIGRTDLPGGNYNKIKESLKNLSKINYKILCPGHLY